MLVPVVQENGWWHPLLILRHGEDGIRIIHTSQLDLLLIWRLPFLGKKNKGTYIMLWCIGHQISCMAWIIIILKHAPCQAISLISVRQNRGRPWQTWLRMCSAVCCKHLCFLKNSWIDTLLFQHGTAAAVLPVQASGVHRPSVEGVLIIPTIWAKGDLKRRMGCSKGRELRREISKLSNPKMSYPDLHQLRIWPSFQIGLALLPVKDPIL